MLLRPRVVMSGLFVAAASVAVAAPSPPVNAVVFTAPHHAIHYLHPRGSQHNHPAATTSQLSYHGGVGGVGIEVTPKVYVVFYGKQWGTATTAGADLTFSNDPKKLAPRVQDFLRGLFGSKDTWSPSTTQFCDGVATGLVQCKSSGRHVVHPATSPLAGIYYDNVYNAVAAPRETSIRASAVRAARHFGNTTSASNASAQYVVVSPTGIVPVGFMSQYCAYHSSYVTAVGNLAYTNLPYIPDAGAGCGQNLVNSGTAGTLDGVTIVEGHEYAETLTDQFPPGGWLDSGGAENGDKCAWITSGPGASANVTLSTGKFAVQSLWSNNAAGGAGACVIYYASATNQH